MTKDTSPLVSLESTKKLDCQLLAEVLIVVLLLVIG